MKVYFDAGSRDALAPMHEWGVGSPVRTRLKTITSWGALWWQILGTRGGNEEDLVRIVLGLRELRAGGA